MRTSFALKALALWAFGLWGSAHTTFAQQENPLWLRYPALSPDGKAIVFSYQGDLFRVDAAGGTAVPLTRHEAYDYRPVWSPDGKTLAFASDRYGNFDIYTMPAEGGIAERKTFHSTNDRPSAFMPDGKTLLFETTRLRNVENSQFPNNGFTQLATLPLEGGRPGVLSYHAMEYVSVHPDGKKLLYHDLKGYEDDWRKRHISAVTRDVFLYDIEKKTHTKVSPFEGEDRFPVWAEDGSHFYYLSEKSGTFNVWKASANAPEKPEQITKHEKHPVRFLSISKDGTLCYGFDGEIYLKKKGEEPQKVKVTLAMDHSLTPVLHKTYRSNASEYSVSPNGKEVAFIVRGEVFVTDVEHGLTKRITNTPEQERSVSFSPDGKKLLYASERNGSWNLYETKIVREEESLFYGATVLKEEALLEGEAETFQPAYSPDGKEVAFLEERTTLKVINLASKKIRKLLDGDKNYSYSDGDQSFAWSPDGKWLTATYLPKPVWIEDIALIAADGSKRINLTNTGYTAAAPTWSPDGNMLLYLTDRYGLRAHGSWGGTMDIMGIFMNQESWDKYRLSPADLAYAESQSKDKKDEEAKKKKEGEKEDEKKKLPEVKIDFDYLEDRHTRLTPASTSLSGMQISPDGKKLYYLASSGQGSSLWEKDLEKGKTKEVAPLGGYAGNLQQDSKGTLFVMASGGIMKISPAKGMPEPVSFRAEMEIRPQEEYAYLYEHMWRQVLKKFYKKDIHGVDWEGYKKAYAKFLPHMTHSRDFAEMASELLGELNGSHTGCRYYPSPENRVSTASLAAFFDPEFTGNGLKIQEVIPKSPLMNAEVKVEKGDIIEKINGTLLTPEVNPSQILNGLAGKRTLITLKKASGETKEFVIKPISGYRLGELLYERWVETRRALAEELSDGKVGYAHVRGMDSPSFRAFYSEVLGRHADKKALIVDTRFNGGGWLHDDLATFLSGVPYTQLVPRGQVISTEPTYKWNKPSAVLCGEGNYSDAHYFPYVYKTLKIGPLVGMPVPGTTTAVWWEMLHTGDLLFGIPQVGVRGMDGKYLENQQLEPDYEVANEAEPTINGEDQQLKKAVEVLLEKVK